MYHWAAFLRGMNLGKRRITNDVLCEQLTTLELREVNAFLASGNVVFCADESKEEALKNRIETGLREALGYEVPTFLRSAEQVLDVAGRNPFPQEWVEATAGKVQVAFLAQPPGAHDKSRALDLASEDDRMAIVGRELFWLPRAGISDSQLDLRALEQWLGPHTIRTQRTIERMAMKYFGIGRINGKQIR